MTFGTRDTKKVSEKAVGELTVRDRILAPYQSVRFNRSVTQVPTGFITRGQLLERTGMSASELKDLEKSGRIIPDGKNVRGWSYYRESIVTELLKASELTVKRGDGRMVPTTVDSNITYSRDEAVLVFGLLKENKTLVETVIESGLHPSLVKTIAKDYAFLAGVVLVFQPEIDEITALPLDGPKPPKSGADILEIFQSAVIDLKCRCGKRKTICHPCAIERFTPKAPPTPEPEPRQPARRFRRPRTEIVDDAPPVSEPSVPEASPPEPSFVNPFERAASPLPLEVEAHSETE